MLDTVIIGAGPAGATAAIYLVRFHRSALLIDGNESRARWIPESHNIIGFPQGIGGRALLSQVRTHAQQYGSQFLQDTVEDIVAEDGGFVVRTAGKTVRSRYVVLATGVQDHLPILPGAEEAVRRGLLRVCPICDGYEATGKQIAVIGNGPHGEREASFLKTYSDQVTLLHIGVAQSELRRGLESHGIELVETALESLTIEEKSLRVRLPALQNRQFDVVYTALGCSPRTELATSLGAACDENGQLMVTSHHETSVSGLYAVGDVVRGLNQVVVAAAEAAVAATHIHNRLRS